MARKKSKPSPSRKRREQVIKEERTLDPRVLSIGTKTIVLMVSVFILNIIFLYDDASHLFGPTPEPFPRLLYNLCLYSTFLLGLAAVVFQRTYKGGVSILHLPTELAVRKYRIVFLLQSICFSIVFLTLLYRFGIIDTVNKFVLWAIPKIEPKISNIISTILGWIVSGVIGNFAYDLLKRKYLAKFSAPAK